MHREDGRKRHEKVSKDFVVREKTLNFAVINYEEINKHNTLFHTLFNDCVDWFGHHDRGVRTYW